MSRRILICTDLDGTLLPNGRAPESASARRHFTQVVARPEVSLAYVTGRHQALVEEAIAEFSLPVPQVVIADVGTTIYDVGNAGWHVWPSWKERLAAQWEPGTREELQLALQELKGLRLQEDTKQTDFKLSYYLARDTSSSEAVAEVHHRLERQSTSSRLIFSRDSKGIGLLDLVPPTAGKLSAIEFLQQRRGFRRERTVFAGDSGNDLEVLASQVPSVLVANASAAVRQQALELAEAKGTSLRLYQAQGGFLGMNGNYSAGILEGLAHFLPEIAEWLP